ncbi:uncharacterized protein LOC114219862 [Eumetopias jubatus]|uniref:uncharacterized protein LOC114219862 n=1 Tax=Eumetopias jubatus TaxID=34886 RepID=UPI0010168C18|nr:uncharacterized protein LOC114219862 [Eumetopias jubatus]
MARTNLRVAASQRARPRAPEPLLKFSYFLSVPKGWYDGHPTSSRWVSVGLTALVWEARGGGGDQLQGLDSQSLVLGQQQVSQVRSLETQSRPHPNHGARPFLHNSPRGFVAFRGWRNTRLLGTFQPWRAGIPCPVLDPAAPCPPPVPGHSNPHQPGDPGTRNRLCLSSSKAATLGTPPSALTENRPCAGMVSLLSGRSRVPDPGCLDQKHLQSFKARCYLSVHLKLSQARESPKILSECRRGFSRSGMEPKTLHF